MKKPSHNDIPSSIYRLQLSSEFPLQAAIAIIPYLKSLGIEGIYCSPIFESAGPQGYDVTNANRLNSGIGDSNDYEQFCTLLQQNGMKQVLDVIPNHMGIKGKTNLWWLDVLENGPSSAYADFFDINWNPTKPALKSKVLLPILKESYGNILEKQELSLIWQKGFWICYQDYQLPIAPSTYSLIFGCTGYNPPSFSPAEEKDWLACLSICKELKRIASEEKNTVEKTAIQKKQLLALLQNSECVRRCLSQLLILFNGEKKNPSSFDLLHDLLEHQFYRLSHWLIAGQEINYRRFFNINDLVAIHIEKEKVLRAHHRWIFELISAKKIQGVRIDHPDGLYDPIEYFKKIHSKNPSFVVAEKILGLNEALPEQWDVDGTVGYDFLNILNGIFIEVKNEKPLTRIYEKFIGCKIDFRNLVYEKKKRFVSLNMGSEIHFLVSLLDGLTEKSRYCRDFTREDLIRAVQEIIACFPVYRTYIKPGKAVSKKDRGYITQAIDLASKQSPEIDISIYNFFKGLLLLEFKYIGEENNLASDFVLRFQQQTAPAMAKGLEDSAYFIYNRLISLNEVGGDPKTFGCAKTEFHKFNAHKLAKWPLGFLSSSTHDTKYSEDVRMRLDVLSEIPAQWQEIVKIWKKETKKYKTLIRNNLFPDHNTEYYIYQMLLGLWPLSKNESSSTDFFERIWQCLFKAIREADIHTSWRIPNPDYESAVKNFLSKLLTADAASSFSSSFLNFQKKIDDYGQWNSLSSVLAKIGSCGIVDIYQGNDTWNFCAMDPDNRRPIDYNVRENMLESFSYDKQGIFAREKVKLYITTTALNFRKMHKELFLSGEYLPLEVEQEKSNNVIAFMRKQNDQVAIILAGRFFAQLYDEQSHENTHRETDSAPPVGEKYWGSSMVILSDDLKNEDLVDIFTGKKHSLQFKDGRIMLPLANAFQQLPLALLTISGKQ